MHPRINIAKEYMSKYSIAEIPFVSVSLEASFLTLSPDEIVFEVMSSLIRPRFSLFRSQKQRFALARVRSTLIPRVGRGHQTRLARDKHVFLRTFSQAAWMEGY